MALLQVDPSDLIIEGQKPSDEENDELGLTTPIFGPSSLEESTQVESEDLVNAEIEAEEEAVVNAETGEAESNALFERESNSEQLPEAVVNYGLLAIYSDKETPVIQGEETNDSETSVGLPTVTVSVDGYPGGMQEGETTPHSKHPNLSEVGKQQAMQGETVTPVKDSSFTSSAGSTPVGKLMIPVAEGSMTEGSITAAEDGEEDSGTPSPCTPRQDEQNPTIADEYLQFWLVMRIFDDKVTIFFHRR